MKDLGILQPENTASFSAKRFPQLGLADDQTLDQLREEFTGFQLSQADLPSCMYKAADGSDKPRSDIFWSKVGVTCKSLMESPFLN